MIYDDPNHPYYGPVRRLHIMAMQLFPNFAKVEGRFLELTGVTWSQWMADRMKQYGYPEATIQRDMIRWFLSIHR